MNSACSNSFFSYFLYYVKHRRYPPLLLSFTGRIFLPLFIAHTQNYSTSLHPYVACFSRILSPSPIWLQLAHGMEPAESARNNTHTVLKPSPVSKRSSLETEKNSKPVGVFQYLKKCFHIRMCVCLFI